EQNEFRIEDLQHDLGRVFVLARLVLPFARLQRTLEVDLRALAQVLFGDLGEPLVEDRHARPLCPLPALAGRLVAPGFRRRHAQLGDRAAVLRVLDLGILAEIADEDHAVNRAAHVRLLGASSVERTTFHFRPRRSMTMSSSSRAASSRRETLITFRQPSAPPSWLRMKDNRFSRMVSGSATELSLARSEFSCAFNGASASRCGLLALPSRS